MPRCVTENDHPQYALSSVHDHAPVLGNAEPFSAHLLVELAILGGFSRAGACRILFGFGKACLTSGGSRKLAGDTNDMCRLGKVVRVDMRNPFPTPRQSACALVTDMVGGGPGSLL